ncbi:hypothetical protein QBC37DRAFT_305133 [Rhypophila decipiens]|uniref:Uncharacterized protein n=1 Tax=Rhypophila decipiens TaxID=261697 RepID=A0AAN6YIQ6_9PEZI|nr:hypothetical protein QBC37DRAFT_305133 [Rhypophila decipiens]
MAITQIVADPSTATIGTPPSEVTSYRTRTVIETSASNSTGAKSSDPSAPIFTTAALSGIGIGALVLGILLGLAAAGCLLCCRRRRSKNGRMPHAEERSVMLLSAPPVPPPKDPAMNSPSSQTQSSPRVTPTSAAAVMPPSSSLVGQANVLLPSEGASDDTIAEELIYLGNLIEEHVKNNYHLNSLHVNHSVLRDSLDGLNLDDTMRNHIAVLALAPHTRHVAICHFLALTIFSALDVHYAHGLTLLPPGVAAFMQSLPLLPHESSQIPKRQQLTSNKATTALDTWRRASAYLLNNNTDKSIPLTPPESPNTQIERFHTAVNRFLSHFVHEDSRALFDQTKNLEGVIYECAVFGYSIFSHPCLWRYTYIHQQHQSTSSDLEKSSLVVLPGLEKLTRLGGEVLGHPDVLVSPSVVSV